MAHQLSALLVIAQRDLLKFRRDRVRLAMSLIFPILIVAVFGGALQSNLGRAVGFNMVPFTFTGVLGLTLFESAALGVISLMEDRETDFSKEMFVAPVSRYTIVGGKVLGETLVALSQAVAIVLFGLFIGVGLTPLHLLLLVPASIACSLLGAAFGVSTLAALPNRRTAQQAFPLVMLPQYFLSGVFVPVNVLPGVLGVLSHLSPMRYTVDMVRATFYAGSGAYDHIVLQGPVVDVAVIAGLFAGFLALGTATFVRRERNR